MSEGRPLRTRNDALLETLEPYLVAAPWHGDRFDVRPFGLAIPDANVIDPTRIAAEPFLDRLETLDRLTFGNVGMPMPRWLFYQIAELPGAIFGFAARAENLDPALAGRLELGPASAGPVPLSMYIAIPAGPGGAWLGHNLASLNRLLPELKLRGLAGITKGVALKVYRCRRQLGAMQWDSPALNIHARFGALRMLTAWTPAHTNPKTITYAIDVTDETLRRGLGDPQAPAGPAPAPCRQIAVDDVAAMRELQTQIEAGERFAVAGRARKGEDGVRRVPISRWEPAA